MSKFTPSGPMASPDSLRGHSGNESSPHLLRSGMMNIISIKENEISGFDRGDTPALAVLETNAKSMAFRRAIETQEELGKITARVETTLDEYELKETLKPGLPVELIKEVQMNYTDKENATLEFVDDMTQLMIILSDPLAKKKYQQQLTIFIVGYENLCMNRYKVLGQLNEFFKSNSKTAEDYEMELINFDIDEVGKNVRTALDKADKAQEKLGQISKEVIKVLETVNPKEAKNRRRKLDKALNQSKEEIGQLTERLFNARKELESNEGKLTQLYKTVEMKQIEIERLKTQVELSRRRGAEGEEAKRELDLKNSQLQEARQEIDRLKVFIASTEKRQENIAERQREARETQRKATEELENKLEDMKRKMIETRTDLERHHDRQLKDLTDMYKGEIDIIKKNNLQQVKDLNATINDLQREKDEQERAKIEAITREASRQTNELTRKNSNLHLKSRAAKATPNSTGTDSSSSPATPKKVLQKDGSIAPLPSTSQSVRDKGVTFSVSDSRPTTKPETISSISENEPLTPLTSTRSMQDAEVQTEDPVQNIEHHFSLSLMSVEKVSRQREVDEDLRGIPNEDLATKFNHYKEETQKEVDSLSTQLSELTGKYNDKIKALKGMVDVRNKWSAERKNLVSRLDAAEKAKVIAEKEADVALLQLEEMLAEQEDMRLKLQQDQANVLVDKETMTSLVSDPACETLTPGVNTESSQGNSQLQDVAEDQMNPSLQTENRGKKEEETQDERAPSEPSVVILDTEGRQTPMPDEAVPEVFPSSSQSRRSLTPSRDDLMSGRTKKRLIRQALKQYPIAEEALATYKAVMHLKSDMEELLEDEGLAEDLERFKEVQKLELDKDDPMEILENLTNMREQTVKVILAVQNILPRLLTEDDEILYSIQNEDDEKVSSLFGEERDETEQSLSDIQEETDDKVKEDAEDTTDSGYSKTNAKPSKRGRGHVRLVADYRDLIRRHQELNESYQALKSEIDPSGVSFKDQLKDSSLMIQELQDTVVALKSELKEFQMSHPQTYYLSKNAPSSDFIFTRQDADYNERALKRGVEHGRVSGNVYSHVKGEMAKYGEFPAQRLVELAKRYSHHVKMKQVEERIMKSKNLDSDVVAVLDKMEELQRQRSERWQGKMESLSAERTRLAHMLVQTIEKVQDESGIFLIKPLMSVPTKQKEGFGGLVSQRTKSPNIHTLLRPQGHVSERRPRHSKKATIMPTREMENGALDIAVLPCGKPFKTERLWKVSNSVTTSRLLVSAHNVPTILDLDINRPMFAHNEVSATLPPGITSAYGPAAHSNLLSYVTVARRPLTFSHLKDRGREASSLREDSAPPTPSTWPRTNRKSSLHSPDVLPPIGDQDGDLPQIPDDLRSVSTFVSDPDRAPSVPVKGIC